MEKLVILQFFLLIASRKIQVTEKINNSVFFYGFTKEHMARKLKCYRNNFVSNYPPNMKILEHFKLKELNTFENIYMIKPALDNEFYVHQYTYNYSN